MFPLWAISFIILDKFVSVGRILTSCCSNASMRSSLATDHWMSLMALEMIFASPSSINFKRAFVRSVFTLLKRHCCIKTLLNLTGKYPVLVYSLNEASE